MNQIWRAKLPQCLKRFGAGIDAGVDIFVLDKSVQLPVSAYIRTVDRIPGKKGTYFGAHAGVYAEGPLVFGPRTLEQRARPWRKGMPVTGLCLK